MASKLRLFTIVCAVSSMVSMPVAAFHDGIQACQDGEIGYLATMIGEGGMSFLFLSSEVPPKADTILCQIRPSQLVQVKANSQPL